MAKLKLRGNDLLKIGYPQGKVIGVAIRALTEHNKKMAKGDALQMSQNACAHSNCRMYL